MKNLTQDQTKRLCEAFGKAYSEGGGSIEDAQHRGALAWADEYDRIRQESMEGDLVERCAKALYTTRTPACWDTSIYKDDYRSMARAVLAEAQLGQCSAGGGAFAPVTEDEARLACRAGGWIGDAAHHMQTSINAVLASRRQRMVMSGDQCGGRHGMFSCSKPRGHADGRCRADVECGSASWGTGYGAPPINPPLPAKSGSGAMLALAMSREASLLAREGAKVAEHCQTEPEEQDAYQITAETYELWQPAQILPPKPPAHVVERGPGLQAIALRELDRPISSKPSHVASFGFDGYDEDP